MSDHDLSPAQKATIGLPADVMARAAEAIDACEDTGYDPDQLVRIFITPALPVLVPAIERIVAEQWAAFADKGGYEVSHCEMFTWYEDGALYDWIMDRLPATTEGATDHD